MKTAIIIHGTCDEEEYFSNKYPSLSNSHWFPWLQKQLLIKGIFTQTPEMPEAYKPDYQYWKAEFERFTVDQDTTLIGHSCGGGFLIRWMTENKISINKLILVAPWLDPTNRRTTDFFDFTIDPSLQYRAKQIHILTSEDEEVEGVKESVEKIRSALPKAQFHQFQNMGHFTFEEMKTDKFPELLKIVL